MKMSEFLLISEFVVFGEKGRCSQVVVRRGAVQAWR